MKKFAVVGYLTAVNAFLQSLGELPHIIGSLKGIIMKRAVNKHHVLKI